MHLSLPGTGVSVLFSTFACSLPACRAEMGAPLCVTCHGAGTSLLPLFIGDRACENDSGLPYINLVPEVALQRTGFRVDNESSDTYIF